MSILEILDAYCCNHDDDIEWSHDKLEIIIFSFFRNTEFKQKLFIVKIENTCTKKR